MKIGILCGDLCNPHMRGLSRYGVGLIRALADAGVEVSVLSREPLAPAYRDIPASVVTWWGWRELVWEQFGVPRMAARLNLDAIHALSNRGLAAFSSKPMVLTRHDAIERLFPPDSPANLKSRIRMWYSDEISIRSARCVTTVSETSRRDVIATWKLPERQVISTGEGIDAQFFQRPPERDVRHALEGLNVRKPYVLYIGGFDKRKDVPTLVEGFHLANRRELSLIIAGRQCGECVRVNCVIQKYGLEQRVRLIGEVADDELRMLYAGADCFIYPSRYEGFGLQAAEALAMGVPLIISDGGALPETSGGHALQFQVGNARELGNRLNECLDDKHGRDRRVAGGLEHASRFRWENVAPAYINVYRSLYGS